MNSTVCNPVSKPFVVSILFGLIALAPAAAIAAGNPCAGANPCAAKASNPCAAKNPEAARAKVDSALITRPAGTKPFTGRRADLAAEGERLWKSTALSSNGMACESCHQNGGAFNPSFAQPYPHKIAMTAERAGLKRTTLEQMVQFCMIVPMAAKPLPWDSRELAALTAYSGEVQKAYIKTAGKKSGVQQASNPCAAKNPCAGRNPCDAKAH